MRWCYALKNISQHTSPRPVTARGALRAVTGHWMVLRRSKNTVLPREPGPLRAPGDRIVRSWRTGQAESSRPASSPPGPSLPRPPPYGRAAAPVGLGFPELSGLIGSNRDPKTPELKKKKNPQTLLKIGCLSSLLSCEMATSLLHRTELLFCCLQTLCGEKKAEASSLRESVVFLKKRIKQNLHV